jgi:hypothetical protein
MAIRLPGPEVPHWDAGGVDAAAIARRFDLGRPLGEPIVASWGWG